MDKEDSNFGPVSESLLLAHPWRLGRKWGWRTPVGRFSTYQQRFSVLRGIFNFGSLLVDSDSEFEICPNMDIFPHGVINVPPRPCIGFVHFCHFSTLLQVYVLVDLDTKSCCALFPSYLILAGDSDINTNIFSRSSVASGLCIAANRKPGDHIKLPGA